MAPPPSLSRQDSVRFSPIEEIHHVPYKAPQSTGVYGNRISIHGRRSSAFDVTIDGALETPRGFKGYTLGAWARNNTAMKTASTVSETNPNSAYLGTQNCCPQLTQGHAPNCNCPDSRLYRESREENWYDAELIEVDLNDTPAVGTGDNPESTMPSSPEEEGTHVGCAFIGPVFPLVGKLGLMQVGWSTFLKDNTFLALRVMQFALALATFVACAVTGYKTKNIFLLEAAALTSFGFSRRVFLLLLYRREIHDGGDTSTKSKVYGLDGLVYQVSGIVLLYSILIATLSYVSPTLAYAAGGKPKIDVAMLLFMVLTAVHILDVWATPIPFRLFYVIVAALINLLMTTVAVTFAGLQIRPGIILLVVGFMTLPLGSMLYAYSRTIYLCFHRERVIAEQKVTGTTGAQMV